VYRYRQFCRRSNIHHIPEPDSPGQPSELIANAGVGGALIGQNGDISVFELKPADQHRFDQGDVVSGALQ